MDLVAVVTTVIIVGVLGATIAYVLIVGHNPSSIPIRSVANPPRSSPCMFLSPNLKFNQLFGDKMPINMTCGDLRKLLQSGA